jgi:hypothetical protein
LRSQASQASTGSRQPPQRHHRSAIGSRRNLPEQDMGKLAFPIAIIC